MLYDADEDEIDDRRRRSDGPTMPKAEADSAIVTALAESLKAAAVDLDPAQRRAVLRLSALAFYDWQGVQEVDAAGERCLSLTGPAGSGKTTVARVLVDCLSRLGMEVTLGAPTGKAAARIRQIFEGTPAYTIHGLIYGKPTEIGVCPTCKATSDILAKSIAELRSLNLARRCPSCKMIHADDVKVESRLDFARTDRAAFEAGNVWLIDEASMVTAQQHADLMHHATKYGGLVIYTGDPNQLPPVEDPEEAQRAHPPLRPATAALETVHRQGAKSGILSAANAILNGVTDGILSWKGYSDLSVARTPLDRLATQTATAIRAGQDSIVLVGNNKLRKDLNQRISVEVQPLLDAIPSTPFLRGQRFQCALNNHDRGVMNGEILTVEDARPVPWDPDVFEVRLAGGTTSCAWFYLVPNAVDAEVREYRWAVRERAKRYETLCDQWAEKGDRDGGDDDGEPEGIRDGQPVGPFQRFLLRNRCIDASRLLHVNLGYVITVHRSQGSQWQHVTIVWDGTFWFLAKRKPAEFRPLIYTALTRAQQRVTIHVPPKEPSA